MKTVLVTAVVWIIALGTAAPARAQLGVVNPFALPPGSPATPFGKDPHPFNNAHLAQPWSVWNPAIREFVVPARVLVVPLAVLEAGGWPAIEWRTVTLPGYRVTETRYGYVVHAHWGVEPVGHAYAWAWRPVNYVAQ